MKVDNWGVLLNIDTFTTTISGRTIYSDGLATSATFTSVPVKTRLTCHRIHIPSTISLTVGFTSTSTTSLTPTSVTLARTTTSTNGSALSTSRPSSIASSNITTGRSF